MKLSDCYYLGYISEGSSRDNRLTIKLDTDNPSDYKKLESVMIKMNKSDQTPVPFFVSKVNRLIRNELSIDINLNNQFPNASFLKGKEVFLPLSSLPELKGNKFYFHEIIGFKVFDKSKGLVGEVKDVYTSTAHPILAINKDDREILVPINDEVIKKVHKEKAELHIQAPEGLIDLYLD